jgi:hypothetical protein
MRRVSFRELVPREQLGTVVNLLRLVTRRGATPTAVLRGRKTVTIESAQKVSLSIILVACLQAPSLPTWVKRMQMD